MDGKLIFSWYDYAAEAKYYLAQQDNLCQITTYVGYKITQFQRETLFESHRAKNVTFPYGKTVKALYASRKYMWLGGLIERSI